MAAPAGGETTPPNTFIFEGPTDPTISTAATFRFSGSDNSTPGPDLAYQCRLDSTDEGDFAACASPMTYTGLSEEQHTFDVRAVDLQGNSDPTPASYTWTVEAPPPDETAPEVTILSGPDLVTVNTSATFTFSATEAVTFECSLDGEPFASCASEIAYTDLNPGEHTFVVRATDLAGNSDEDDSEASYTWTITPPPRAYRPTSAARWSPRARWCTTTCSTVSETDSIIGANDITIDLDGHTIDGAGLGGGHSATTVSTASRSATV